MRRYASLILYLGVAGVALGFIHDGFWSYMAVAAGAVCLGIFTDMAIPDRRR